MVEEEHHHVHFKILEGVVYCDCKSVLCWLKRPTGPKQKRHMFCNIRKEHTGNCRNTWSGKEWTKPK